MPDPVGTSIRLFLVDGTFDGLWVIEKGNWTGKALMSPRHLYGELRDRQEMTGPGVYILLGPAEDPSKPIRMYIGEAEVLRKRLDTHQKEKEFWTKTVVFTAKDSNLNKAHIRYLESRLQAVAATANRAVLDNTSFTSLPSLSEADCADLESFLADMLLIYPVLGVTAFQSLDQSVQTQSASHLFLTGKSAKAEGQEISEGFLVFKGALARADSVPSIHPWGEKLRESLTTAGVFVVEGDHLRLTEDYVFGSPSFAATVLLGKSANGRTLWMDSAGITLKALQEQALE